MRQGTSFSLSASAYLVALACAGEAQAACPQVRAGATLTAEELLARSQQIYLVEVADLIAPEKGEGPVTGHFKIVESIRGKPRELIFNFWSSDPYNDSD